MIEQLPVWQDLPARKRKDEIAAPLLYVSSAEAGWEGLVAQAFHEPPELEGWISPPTPDIALILFRGGAMRMAQRHIQGSWKELSMRQGDLMLRTGVNASHEVRWKSLSATPTKTLHLHVSKDLFARAAEEVAGCDPARVSLVARSGFRDPLLMQIGFALWHELEQAAPAGKLYAQTAAQLIAIHLLRHYTAAQKPIREATHGLTQQQVRRVTDFVREHIGLDLTLEILAQQTGFSPYHFARLFRQTIGESPHQFVTRQRIEQAQRLLGEADLPLAQVALVCGFANQSHFTQAFKRHVGLTPRAYRRDRAIGADF